jgi:hypothetical protein
MTIKEFFKSVETIVVLGGLLLTIIYGKFWAYATFITYIVINVPSLIGILQDLVRQIKKK